MVKNISKLPYNSFCHIILVYRKKYTLQEEKMRKLIWILCFCLLFLVACTKNAKSPGNTNNTKQPTKTETSEALSKSAFFFINADFRKSHLSGAKPKRKFFMLFLPQMKGFRFLYGRY